MKKKVGNIILDMEVCKGCYLCISVCPQKLIAVSEKLNQKGWYPAEFIGTNSNKENRCTGCALCATVCPDIAIEVYRE